MHDFCLLWSVTYHCNFDCLYCNVVKSYAAEEISIEDVWRTLEDTKRIARITFTGGEPFLVPNFIELCEKLTQKHYITVNTNMTTDRIEEFLNRVDKDKILHILCSAHLEQLEKRNLMDRYFKNIDLIKSKGIKVFTTEVAHPSVKDLFIKYRKVFADRGLNLGTVPYCGIGVLQEYTQEERELFGIKDKDVKKYYVKGKECSAGHNTFRVVPNGDIKVCSNIHKTVGSIYYGLRFNKPMICPKEFCSCPMGFYAEKAKCGH